MTLGVIMNTTRLRERPETGPPAREAVAALVAAAGDVRVGEEAARLLGFAHLACGEEELGEQARLLVAFGGDGTILRAARLAAPRGIPILGVNMGGFGFLAELNLDQFGDAVPRLLAGRYEIDERMMLEAAVERGGTPQRLLALNDIVVTKSGVARVLRLRISVNGEHLASYPADGVIVATPTGSTAYSLSAGGPILAPRVEALVITPISPHTFNSRSVVVDRRDEVMIEVTAPEPEATLTVDGRVGVALAAVRAVVVRRAEQVTRFVRLGGHTFYGILRTKLAWGERASLEGEQ
ncbi:MAG: NAD(+)/NADH kinase [Armatimonadota bacterium]|nr:NAD(+)/NADH kinase [Armatimonadota bacterium]MDR7450382.1 NAD(+)/NADH kinase [Armatimonadota bacterium]MDR7467035.1 NAD(+)/NADH kinase [Armatimonadota bacterium]MDR7493423.1 NAD(+)/NADH kinase [Armatimonadota bacterium]MDR7498688.1 NAD(+)/NADH kinase [Armatimonadota bacterium]